MRNLPHVVLRPALRSCRIKRSRIVSPIDGRLIAGATIDRVEISIANTPRSHLMRVSLRQPDEHWGGGFWVYAAVPC